MQAIRTPGILIALLTAFCASVTGTAGQQATPATAAALAARIQARYDTIRDFTADFTLAQTGGLVMRGAFDRGKVSIRKPGHMRWVFETGSRNEVVADGIRVYSYFPQDKYVQVVEMPKDGRVSSGLLLLTGRGSITRDFVASLPTSQSDTESRVVLTPKTKQAEFSTLTLSVDQTTLQLRGLDVLDPQGTLQTFRFANLRENQGLKDAVFEFRIPKGVEIR